MPPARMKLPSCTLRIRRTAGSKVSVSEIVVNRETFAIINGTVYGPEPTRHVVPGTVTVTSAEPTAAVGGGTCTGGVGGAAVAPVVGG